GLDKYDKWLNSSTGILPVPHGQDVRATSDWPIDEDKLRRKLAIPSQGRLYYIRYAMKMGWTIEQIYQLTKIDRWFLAEMKELVDFELQLWEIDQTKPHWRDPECEGSDKADKYIELVKRAKELG